MSDLHRMAQLDHRQVAERIRYHMWILARDHGVRVGASGTMIALHLVNREWAELCGTTMETTIRMMNRLKEEGFFKVENKNIYIEDLDALVA